MPGTTVMEKRVVAVSIVRRICIRWCKRFASRMNSEEENEYEKSCKISFVVCKPVACRVL